MLFQQAQPVRSGNSNIIGINFDKGSSAFQQALLAEQDSNEFVHSDDHSLDHLTDENLLSSIEELISSQGEQGVFLLQQLLEEVQIPKLDIGLQHYESDLNSNVTKGSEVETLEQSDLSKLYSQLYAQLDLVLNADEEGLEVPAELLKLLVGQTNFDDPDEGILLLEQLVEELVSSDQLDGDTTLQDEEDSDINQFTQLSSRIELLLSHLSSEHSVPKVSPEMMELLIDQTKLLKPEEGKALLEQLLEKLGHSGELDDWKPLDSQTQFAQLYAQAESLLASLSDGQDVFKVSPRILELLEKWTTLANTFNQQVNGPILHSEIESEEFNIWEKLIVAYQKRSELATNQRYYANAQVTSKDIAKWLQNGLNTDPALEATSSSQQVNVSSVPISRLEQHVIHINQTETSEPAAKQLIDQFQSAMRTSRFLSMNNGVNQLSIAIRPDNLGEMMVRLTEINGEMTLKIIVSSQSTRQMLESNLHQLKNMFSPHQVVIEEQEINLQETQSNNEEQAFDERDEDHSEQSNQDNLKDIDEDIETSFHELLMNEKV